MAFVQLLTSSTLGIRVPPLGCHAIVLSCVRNASRAEQSCPAVPRTDIEVNDDGLVDDAALRRAIRCIRLRYYSPEEAEWALTVGHLDASWEGPAVTAADGVLHAVMEKDISVRCLTSAYSIAVLHATPFA